MICRPDMIMKLATNTKIAPITGGGMIDSSALSLGEKPSRINSPPATKPITRLVAPEALLNDTLLAEVSEAIPPSNPDRVTHRPSATSPPLTRVMSGRLQPSSLIFSHRMRLPKDFSAPVIETIAKVGNNDQLKAK